MSLKKVGSIDIKCNMCNKEKRYPIYTKGEAVIHPLYCSYCGEKLKKVND